jgi:hypothetical protein
MNKTRKNHLFLLLALLGLMAIQSCEENDVANIQDTIEVSGIVSDDKGTPLEGVIVTDGTSQTDTSNLDGTYFLNAVSKTATLTFDKAEHIATTVAVNARSIVYATLLRSDVRIAKDTLQTMFSEAGNALIDPLFAAGSLRPTISLGTNFSTVPAGFTTVGYKGAVALSGNPWFADWSFYERLLAGETTSAELISGGNLSHVTDADMEQAGSSIAWDRYTTYVLEDTIYIRDGQTLTIEAGTVIKSKPNAALVIARGAQIMANGSAQSPVVFTFDGDIGGTPVATTGTWGGLYILGSATTNLASTDNQLEGFPNSPASLYGGNDSLDNSGQLKYVSIRHGGGLVLAGVGAGTVLDNVEVVAANGNGITWLGGTVPGRRLIGAFCQGSAYYCGQGYRGTNQFIVAHQYEAAGGVQMGNGGALPYTHPRFYNATFIGDATSQLLGFRNNAAGEFHNSIFQKWATGVGIAFIDNSTLHSYQRLLDGELGISNSVFDQIGGDYPFFLEY